MVFDKEELLERLASNELKEKLRAEGFKVEEVSWIPEEELIRSSCPVCGTEVAIPLEFITKTSITWCNNSHKFPTLQVITQH